MKTFIIILFAVVAVAGDALAQKKFSDYPNSTTLQSGDLFIFSRAGTGTYNIDAFSQMPTALGLGTAAYTASTAYDAAGAATAATNALGLGSGLSANVTTNRFITPAQQAILSNNINGANIFGQIPAGSLGSGSSISTKFLRGDSTWQTISGGGDLLAANNLSDVSSISTARGNLGAAASATTVTTAGTANQINSSTSSAQALSGNVATTLSLSSTLLLPGTLNVTGAQTNQSTLWIHGNQTNDTGLYVSGTLVANTANFSQANIATAWLTNAVIPTNAFAGTTVDFSQSDGQTNLGGNLTFTAVANVTAGGANTRLVRLLSGGSDRTIAFPASWHTNFNFIGVVTNGFEMDLLFTVTGQRTNVAQILYP